MTSTDKATVARIVTGLIVSNMTEHGMSYTDAKEAAFSRMMTEAPEVTAAWVVA